MRYNRLAAFSRVSNEEQRSRVSHRQQPRGAALSGRSSGRCVAFWVVWRLPRRVRRTVRARQPREPAVDIPVVVVGTPAAVAGKLAAEMPVVVVDSLVAVPAESWERWAR